MAIYPNRVARREDEMPAALKLMLITVLSGLLIGAAALVWFRGTAMLLDIGSSAAQFLCF